MNKSKRILPYGIIIPVGFFAFLVLLFVATWVGIILNQVGYIAS